MAARGAVAPSSLCTLRSPIPPQVIIIAFCVLATLLISGAEAGGSRRTSSRRTTYVNSGGSGDGAEPAIPVWAIIVIILIAIGTLVGCIACCVMCFCVKDNPDKVDQKKKTLYEDTPLQDRYTQSGFCPQPAPAQPPPPASDEGWREYRATST